MMRTFENLFSQSRRAVAFAAGISAALSLLALVGPLYGLLVLDQVVDNFNANIITALTVIAAAAILAMVALDMARGVILARTALWLDHVLGQLLFENGIKRALSDDDIARDAGALEDLRRFLLGPHITSVLDAIWAPLLIAVVFVVHPLMGFIALTGAASMAVITLWQSGASSTAHTLARGASNLRAQFERHLRADPRLTRALGLSAGASNKWEKLNRRRVANAYHIAKRCFIRRGLGNGIFYLVEFTVIAVGALMAMGGQVTTGDILAGVMATTRVMLSLRQAGDGWLEFTNAATAWKRLRRLESVPINPVTDLPVGAVARGHMRLTNVSVTHQGRNKPSLNAIDLEVLRGECLVLSGPGGSGKSTLAAVIAGAVKAQSGIVTLDGAALNQWQMSDDGGPIGYAPDDPLIIEGSVYQNIVRFRDAGVMGAAHAAMQVCAHQMLGDLPGGYKFQTGPSGRYLSMRERRAVGRARALCGEPVIVVFDEPELGMSTREIEQFARALKTMRDDARIGIVISTNNIQLQCIADRAVLLNGGRIKASGDPFDILSIEEGPDSGRIPWNDLSAPLASYKEQVS